MLKDTELYGIGHFTNRRTEKSERVRFRLVVSR